MGSHAVKLAPNRCDMLKPTDLKHNSSHRILYILQSLNSLNSYDKYLGRSAQTNTTHKAAYITSLISPSQLSSSPSTTNGDLIFSILNERETYFAS